MVSEEFKRLPSEKRVPAFLQRALVAFALGVATALASTSAGAAGATSYVFTVTCPDKSRIVEQWTVDGEDPGKEFFRGKSVEKHQGCSAADYKAATDSALLKNTQFFNLHPKEKSWLPEIGNPLSGLWK
ncbi:MAG: hypothetical protein WAK01_00355 [Methylocystis sp.]